MPKWFRSLLVLALPLSILAACGTDRESASPVDTTLDLTGVADFCPDENSSDPELQEISELIEVIFPTSKPARKSLRHVATVNCGQIFYDDSKGKETEAIEKAFAFFQKTLEQNEAGQLLDPPGDDTTEDKIVELFTAIFAGIGFPLPEIDPEVLMGDEYVIGTLSPGGSLLTPGRRAGLADPHGALSGPVQVFIVQIFADEGSGPSLSSESHPCPAGVDNSFDCYPLFYDYSVSPESNVDPEIGLQLGQCNVAPVGDEPVIRLLTPEGFLPLDDAPTGIECEGVEPEVTMTGWRSYAWTVLEPVSPIFRVTPAFAGQSPIGGRISNFSPVAPADPNSGDTETLGSISGTVSASNEEPIQSAVVELFDSGENLVATTETDEFGGYSFSELELGSYSVQASADGFQGDTELVELTEEDPDATVNFFLSPIVVD